jgi:RNase P subunit RPR2
MICPRCGNQDAEETDRVWIEETKTTHVTGICPHCGEVNRLEREGSNGAGDA